LKIGNPEIHEFKENEVPTKYTDLENIL
jgi:hypothetical protein